MAYNRLAGLEKGNCVFLGCFRVSAAGGFVYIYVHARARKGFGLGRAFLFAGKFRKQNTGFPSLFRKLNSVGYV